MKLEDLKKEMPFKWRVQSANQWGASCVAYIDARDVQDALDKVCGVDGWQVRYEENKNNLFCKIGIKCNDDEYDKFIWKSDCGTESMVEKQKGEASDAFKRAAVMWGIGRFLYHKPIIKLPVKEKQVGKMKKFVPFSESTGRFVTKAEDVTKWCNQLSE